MTILNPSARCWDATPKRRIVTTIHRIAFDAGLGSRVAAAQAVQSAVYDATLAHLDRHGHKRWQVPSDGPDSVLKWLTRERRKRIASPTLRIQAASDRALSSLQFQGSNSSIRLLGCSAIRWSTSVSHA